MSGDDSPTTADTDAGPTDAERLLDTLVDEGVVRERADGTLVCSEGYDATHDVYHDTYGDASEELFERTVAEVFDLPPEAAAERIEQEGVTRTHLVTYLAVKSELDGSYTRGELARMATMVEDLSPDSPVPDGVERLDDESYEAFLAEHDRAVVTVWKHHCEPCRAVKSDLDAVLDAIPDGVAVGGVDGVACPAFRRRADVNVAPALVVFADGDGVETLTGRFVPEQVTAACDRAFD
ncbi:thioredoxin domain-containing protein [Halomarina oriensis]|uniref:Thioredoxin n=1 Tax=Halomarina oriensis TaxID=671145 RepID=A0A6B0GPM3_9EURY|nr:thioredoxin family protein [Halomarina oriensis]MWG36782.1 thioredoxin [Halomarina oriensis]